MARDSQGNYSLPPGTLVNSGDMILVSQHNPAMVDIAAGLSKSLDRDGTGGMRAPLNLNGFPIQNVMPGENPNDVATVSQIGGGGVPVGTVVDFAGSIAPTGWLVCGGQSVSRTTYADLFAAIGTTYGSVDGLTFNLPDCRGRTTAGRDFTTAGLASRLTNTTMTPDGATLGATGGAQTHTLTEAQMPAHTHTGSTASAGAHSHSYNATYSSQGASGFDFGGFFTQQEQTGAAGAHTHAITMNNAGGGGAHPNVQPTILFNKIIRTGV
jgi:microcystin-dependent protein